MSSKIDIFDEGHECYLAWVDEDDAGAWVGQESNHSVDELEKRRATAKADRTADSFELFEYLSVEIAAAEWASSYPSAKGREGYRCESLPQAKELLKVVRAALRSAKSEYDSDVPWPDWAKQANAAGWKPPKGWKP